MRSIPDLFNLQEMALNEFLGIKGKLHWGSAVVLARLDLVIGSKEDTRRQGNFSHYSPCVPNL